MTEKLPSTIKIYATTNIISGSDMKQRCNVIIIILLINSKFTPIYVFARETKQILEPGFSKFQNEKQKLCTCAELKKETLEVEKINFTHKSQRWKRVPMFDCLQTYPRKYILPNIDETSYQNSRAHPYLFKVKWITPSYPFKEAEESLLDKVTLDIENSTSCQVPRAKQKPPPVKYKVTAASFNMITPSYEEEPEFKARATPHPRRNKTNEKPDNCNDILVINAPSNLGGLPVVVVTDKTNHVLRLSLKKNTTKLSRTLAKYMCDWDNNEKANKIDNLLKNNYYVSAQKYLSFRPLMVYDPRYDKIRKIEESDMLCVVPNLKHNFTGTLPKSNLKQSGNNDMTNVQREINRQLIENLIRLMKKRIITRGLRADGKIEIKLNKH